MLDELVQKILKNTNNYYNGKPCVDDELFDQWIEELRAIDPNHYILSSTGWGYDLDLVAKEKYPHLNYLSRIKNKPKVAKDTVLPSGRVKLPKLDGGSVELQYLNGRLMIALTRGDGTYGFDCTEKLKYAQGVPVQLSNNFTGNIVGEYVISDEDLEDYSNSDSQRNIPNGMLSRNNASPDECSKFAFIAYKVDKSTSHQFVNRVDILNFIRELGFITTDYILGSVAYQEAIDQLRCINGKHYLLDGIVSDTKEVIVKDSGIIEYPDEIAYKTITDTAVSKVTYVDWNLTRTGKLVPTLTINRVYLSGAEITHVLAHNAKYMKDSGISVGAEIEVTRSGEVIPYILGVVDPVNCELLEYCPECSHPLSWSGPNLVCKNIECSGQKYAELYQWISTLAKVDNLGSSLIYAMIDSLEINEIEDFYGELDYSKLMNREGIGSAKVEVAKSAIESLKSEHSLVEYLVAANIHGLGWTSASKIIDNTSIANELKEDFFSEEFEEELIQLRGVNYNTKLNLLKRWNRLVDLKEFMPIQNPTEEVKSEESKDLLKVCITGKLIDGTKKQFYQKYQNLIQESDIKSCDYLICNEDRGSSKRVQAEKLGKKIVSESELLKIIL